MKVSKEYSSIGCFPSTASYSCFFHTELEYCGLASFEKKLHKSQNQAVKNVDLTRKYHKLLYNRESVDYLAYTCIRQKNEITVYRLDQQLQEYDIQYLRMQRVADIEDIWLDGVEQLLYVVSPFRIQNYNLNGDYLGSILNAPFHTRYKAVCTEGNSMFVAYERFGCIYVAWYNKRGIFKEKLSIGECFFVGNMEVQHVGTVAFLNLYGKRQGKIAVCLEVTITGAEGEQKQTGNAPVSSECQDRERYDIQNEICVEMTKMEGIGETTCFLSCPKTS